MTCEARGHNLQPGCTLPQAAYAKKPLWWHSDSPGAEIWLLFSYMTALPQHKAVAHTPWSICHGEQG